MSSLSHVYSRYFLLICLILSAIRLVSFHIHLSLLISKGGTIQAFPGGKAPSSPTVLSCNTEKTEKPGITGLPILMPISRSRMGKRGYLRKDNLFIHKANFLQYHSSTTLNSKTMRQMQQKFGRNMCGIAVPWLVTVGGYFLLILGRK